MNKPSNEEILNEFRIFDEDKFSLIISSTSKENIPLTNYSPFVKKDGNYYISVSSNLPHYKNMIDTKQAHIMIMQDEKEASHIYARKRLYFNAACELIENKDEIFDLFDERYGKDLTFLRDMNDFAVIKLIPQDKSLVLGFGGAYLMNTKGELIQKTISHK